MRLFGTLAVVLFAGMAAADVLPTPVPKGKKRVGVEVEVLLSKDVTGYVFVYAISDDSGPAPVTPRRFGPPDPNEPKTKYIYKKVELSDTKPFKLRDGRSALRPNLYAIPEDLAKRFKTDDDLCAVMEKGQINGWIGFGEYPGAEVRDTIKEDRVTWTYTITAIDPKTKEITRTITGEGYEPPAKKDEPKKPLALLDQPGYLIGGLALAVGVTFGGLWLVRRRK